MKTCTITGHRDLPHNFDKNALYERFEALIKEGCDCFLCGMAEGFDLVSLDCLVSLRQKYPLTLVACIPFSGQERRFSAEYKRLYCDLLAFCDKKTVLSANYFDGCFLARDRYMVDNCDLVFAYCKKENGGTYYTVSYAKNKGVPVVFFD